MITSIFRPRHEFCSFIFLYFSRFSQSMIIIMSTAFLTPQANHHQACCGFPKMTQIFKFSLLIFSLIFLYSFFYFFSFFSFFLLYPLRDPQILLKNQNLRQNSLQETPHSIFTTQPDQKLPPNQYTQSPNPCYSHQITKPSKPYI